MSLLDDQEPSKAESAPPPGASADAMAQAAADSDALDIIGGGAGNEPDAGLARDNLRVRTK